MEKEIEQMTLDEEGEVRIEKDKNIGKYRQWFVEAVDFSQDWQDEAQEDYDFVSGQQWSESEKKAFEDQGRPSITINKIKPLINVLSGYQRLNRYDIEFLPRTSDDTDICQVRKGITKYIMDSCDYDTHESVAFLDAAITGIGWLDVGYKFNELGTDGEAYVRREDPFGIYIDPETHRVDLSDSKYICRAKWVDKDELKSVFPEHAEEIETQYRIYDSAEYIEGKRDNSLWYKQETNKIRLVECWYKVREPRTMLYLNDGNVVTADSLDEQAVLQLMITGVIIGEKEVSVTKVKVCSFFDEVLLEDIDSPYEHGEFPLVPITCYYYGAGDLPAGFVRDLKDPQREINKRRIQTLHILNTTGNGGGWMEADAMDAHQKSEFRKHATVPGHYQEVRPGALSSGKIQEKGLINPPAALIQAESQATSDLTAISGINEALMGTDIASSASGRAIELKQKQAITHIAPMFDNLRKAKKKIAYLLWGKRDYKGIIPQYYTEDKIYRVEGTNGQQFIRVNQQVQQQDPMGNIIHSTLNDLSQGEFDIVISDVSASTTQRQAQLWSLIDAVKNLGIPGDLVFDVILDLSDIPNKNEIKQRYQERQQAQVQQAQQQAQAQMQLEMVKNQNLNQSIAFKDAPLPLQFAMAAKQGLIDPKIAEYSIDMMVQQMFPQLAEQMAQQRQQAAMQQQAAQQQAMMQQRQGQQLQQGAQPGQQPPPPPQQQTPPQSGGDTMTKAALQSLMSGMGPAM